MHTLLRTLTVFALVTGIALTVSNAMTYSQARTAMVGSDVVLHGAATAPLLPDVSIVPAYEKATAADQLVVGILLILLGFFLHALVLSREERKVHITVKPRRSMRQWFLVEMRM